MTITKIGANNPKFFNPSTWLGDFCLFMALKEAHGGGSWVNWPRELLSRDPQSIQAAMEKHRVAIQRQEFRQFIFHRQWSALREHARENAALLGVAYEEIKGSLAYFEKMVKRQWDKDKFIVLQPGQEVVQRMFLYRPCEAEYQHIK